MNIIGLIPAGGKASRLGKLPCSKEVFPVKDKNGQIFVISSNLISYFQKAGILNIFFIIRKGKWDIPEYFGDGSHMNVNMGYLIMNKPYGTPFTIDQAYPFIKENIVSLGFPDIIFKPADAFVSLKTKFLKGNADIILGVVPHKEFLTTDMIEFAHNGEIKDIVIKQNRPDLRYGWFIALWRPSFTEFMHKFLADFIQKNPDGLLRYDGMPGRELYIGDIMRAGLTTNLTIEHIIFKDGRYIDLGTPESVYEKID
jgi:glucose-1-phosphate thymidylyltransferase